LIDRDQLRDALNHLYDPTYHPSRELLLALGLRPDDQQLAAKNLILRNVANLKPANHTPAHAIAYRLYRVLDARYVRNLTQRQAADELAITVRHVARLQEQAVELLAETIEQGAGTAAPPSGLATMRQQIEEEVSSLYSQAGSSGCDVAVATQSAVEFALPMALAQHVAIHFADASDAVRTSAPLAAVRQAVLSTLTFLLRLLDNAEIHLQLRARDGWAELSIEGGPVAGACPEEPWLIHELLASARGEVECESDDGAIRLILRLPPEPEVRVLAIDDNSDQLHFYARCLVGTRFQLTALRDGRQALVTAHTLLPDLIVLDVMLPNSDGWELLAQLANDPVTRGIPIIVCSVVNEADLAVSLGAKAVAAKPVSRSDFLAALQQALLNGAAARR